MPTRDPSSRTNRASSEPLVLSRLRARDEMDIGSAGVPGEEKGSPALWLGSVCFARRIHVCGTVGDISRWHRAARISGATCARSRNNSRKEGERARETCVYHDRSHLPPPPLPHRHADGNRCKPRDMVKLMSIDTGDCGIDKTDKDRYRRLGTFPTESITTGRKGS